MKFERIILKPEQLAQRAMLSIQVPNNENLQNIVKQLGAEFDSRAGVWYLPAKKGVVNKVYQAYKGKAWVDYGMMKKDSFYPRVANSRSVTRIKKKLNDGQKESIIWYKKKMQSRGYSDNTIVTYCNMMEVFFTHTGDKEIHTIDNRDVIEFNSEFIVKTNRSASFQRQAVNAIKLFFNQFSEHSIDTKSLERVKKQKRLPEVLSLDEIKKLIAAYKNVKHKTIIVLTYSCGLRRSEVINLRWRDIDRTRMVINVRLGKGNKDRPVVLPQATLIQLEKYYRQENPKPKEFVFEGQKARQYSSTSMAKILKNGLKKAGIKKNATLHTLRHSYATHLHENGTDILLIQRLLGHQSMKTTEIYTHISKKSLHGVKNPIEDMEL